MKSLTIFLLLVICTSTSFAAWDYTISNTYEFGIRVEGAESLLVTGGGVDQIDAFDFGYIEIRNTAPLQMYYGGINSMWLHDDSALNYYGGATGGLSFTGNTTGVLEGGSINYISSFQDVTDGPHIEIVSKDYNHNEITNLLTGTWMDGTNFSIQLVDQDPQWYAPVIDNIFFTPEPTSLVLLGLGGLMLRRKNG